ncbi:recombinase family protein [Salipiger mangrovisoli]|uniref:Recombinase family protein n=1 Tax=Salipiger mangrovisoli TaxID=2865933 RepID=A0ABR9X8A1_9RHOB|nr:recombinase family protein [Salipiger mangrovisoli]MBE9639778.1 recombinase family protein [Salipiger mangrovisoli]
MTPTPKTVLYVRVSTAGQTSAHQLTQARAAGFHIEDEHVITDHGVSGVKTIIKERDQGRRLFDLLQAGDTLLVRWVDRLGRNYRDVKQVIEHFNAKGVTVKTVINNMTFEADYKLSDPTLKAARDAILAFMAALAEADNKAKSEARQAGIDHVRASPEAKRKYRGKPPSFDRATLEMVQSMLTQDRTISEIARDVGISRQTVHRIQDEPQWADAALIRWGM